MTFEEYLARFHLIQHAINKDEKMLELFSGPGFGSFLRRFAESQNPTLKKFLISPEALKKRIAKRKRLAEKYAIRLARACNLMENPELREYAVYHFLSGLTHEDLAERSHFCVRTVYRQGKKARKELEKCLLLVMPKRKRITGKKFTCSKAFSLRRYALDAMQRSIAAVSARRRGAPITSSAFCR